MELSVRQIRSTLGKDYIRANHYSGSCHNGPMCWGLYRGDDLVGVCAFATPCSENVRKSVFGEDNKHRVTELHRLHTQDGLPENTLSWFVARAIRQLMDYRPNLRAILSFADSTEGHSGTIYKALNFMHKGSTGRARFYRDSKGRLRHPRQNGKNISLQDAEKLEWEPEWREAKSRYLLVVGPTKREKRYWSKQVKI